MITVLIRAEHQPFWKLWSVMHAFLSDPGKENHRGCKVNIRLAHVCCSCSFSAQIRFKDVQFPIKHLEMLPSELETETTRIIS